MDSSERWHSHDRWRWWTIVLLVCILFVAATGTCIQYLVLKEIMMSDTLEGRIPGSGPNPSITRLPGETPEAFVERYVDAVEKAGGQAEGDEPEPKAATKGGE